MRWALPLVLVGCSTAVGEAPIEGLPSKQSFVDDGVSAFLERRCGSLDCHGQEGRPLRIYSQWGLRLAPSADGTRNAGATTAEERSANYLAVVGLEPENMAKCFADGSYDTFQLLLKPLAQEGRGIRHKGGPVLRATEADPGWQCLYGWARNQPSKDDCTEAQSLQ